MTEEDKNSWSKYHRNSLLIFGLALTGLGIYHFSTLLTFKSQLANITGVLSSADMYVTTVEQRRGAKSQKSELVFYISGRQQKFSLIENIGDEYRNETFEKIIKDLNRADSITVWVKQTELDTYEPKIFQIDTDRKTILEFETVRTENSETTLFLLFLGVGSLIFYFWAKARAII